MLPPPNADIGYSFMISSDGEVYVGRSWDIQGANTYGYNRKSIGIAFIGTFLTTEPTDSQLDAAKRLLELGVKDNKLAKDYKLLAHCQVLSTESPGQKLYNIIQKWDHWTDKP
ncbi:LOW QUALITY PROTEIN: peptidoglycan-recognition protein SA-like [Copidosoma floridanum]|uniref:LOW QUALITY PROTEIN: peptidoglycan-recognition protein SA-like n=1 Tax=Copidosoma floridanum TaxID=29053 RepID=UPI0006C9B0ED|nr:LOW QUALITY PROTEIN: peptidoglycan-recognition protein SA-like [Copidosoma floridanum]